MTAKSSRSQRRPHGWPIWWVRLVQFGLLTVLVGAVPYVVYLDHTVRTQFEGKRWALPARVYARPLELFQGANLSAEHLSQELTRLGYVSAAKPETPGTFARVPDGLRVVTRTFRFWDSTEPSLSVRVVFDGDTVRTLRHAVTGAPLDLVRLDPLLIGSIYPSHHEDRVLVQIKEVPPLLIKTLTGVEDRHFYEHPGIDPFSILRAMWANLRAGSTVQGGSTLTQQLVKNFYLSSERSLWRKLNEAIMSLLLEAHYSKDEILEAYLNEVFLGQEGSRAIHGFGLASQFYFNRPLTELKPAHFALLVGLVRGASYYDPRRHPDRALALRNHILDALAEQGVLGAQEAASTKKNSLGVTPRAPSGISPYPAFMDLVRRQLQHDYKEEDLTSEGLQIFTTLDLRVQDSADLALSTRIAQLEKQYQIPAGQLEGAALVTRTENAEVLAVVGGRATRYSGFNRALDAQRPIGSLVKPAVYLTALMQPQKYTLTTTLDDSPFTLKNPGGKVWAPRNYDHEYHGAVALHTALARSLNVPTARLGVDIGIPNVVRTLGKLGIERTIPPYPSVLLGAVDLTPLEVTQMYQTLASGGFRTPLRAIREVLTAKGEPLQHYALSIEQVIDPAPLFLVTSAMQEVVSAGTARSLYAQLPAGLAIAGKTGTTDDLRDSWFAGFSGQHLAVAWLGRDDNRPVGLSGASGALRVWGDIISRIGTQPLRPTQPANIELVTIDTATHLRGGPGCSEVTTLPFISGSAPQEYAPCASDPENSLLRFLKNVF
ncbi:MAG: penicillin-binding protein 1B [Proteobacteria bacterium]|nr:penicillin-binding protein 1B [Pseudomonadota bacterium]